jgi:hypothetical protein
MAPNENAVGAPMCSPDAVGAPPRSPDAAAPRAAPPPAWEARLARDVAALGGDLGLILGPCGCGKSRLLRRLVQAKLSSVLTTVDEYRSENALALPG